MKDKIRLLLSIAALTATFTGFANRGFYMGISGQENSINLKTTGGSTAIPQENLFGLGLGAYTGFNFPIYNNFSIASEAFINENNSGSSRTFMSPLGDTPTTEVYYIQRNDMNWGASLLPNYQFNKRIFGYLRSGFLEAHMTKTGNNDPSIPPNYSVYRLGWQNGIGFELALSYHWHLRGEYDYTFFTQQNIGGFHINPKEQTFLLGLTYYINSSEPPDNTEIPDEKPNQLLYYTPPEQVVSLDYNAFYVGAFGGASSLNMWKTETKTVTPVSGASEAVTRLYNTNLAMPGLYYNVFFGVSEAASKHLYAALEADFTGANVVTSDTSPDTSQNWSIARGNGFGLSYLPGYIIDHRNLLYFRTGIVLSHFEKAGDYYPATNFTEWDPGLKLGCGYEFAVTNTMSLRAEYDYTIYRTISKNTNIPGDGTPSNPTVNVATNYQPTDNQFNVGLNFRF